jgi:hypothetical protein
VVNTYLARLVTTIRSVACHEHGANQEGFLPRWQPTGEGSTTELRV